MKEILLSFILSMEFLACCALLPGGAAAAEDPEAMTVAETRVFMKQLAQYVFDHHLKKDPDSEQRGMLYEYFDTTRAGQLDQWVQGEALDTMHDGAWFAAAMVAACRATGDPFYKKFLTDWILPFYCKMLNHGDSLFSAQRNDARPGAPRFDRAHLFQEGEKGFAPYFWDDGASVSLERRNDRNALGPFPCTDRLAGQPNTNYVLTGHSHGSSNHMAQDLGVMLETAWLLLHDSDDPADRRLAAEVALAARHLQESRMRHHGHIPMCDAPAALANGDAELMKHVPDGKSARLWLPDNHYFRALYDFKSGQRHPFPGFADDQEFAYYATIARNGGKLPRAQAFDLIYDAFTEPLLYAYYCDDAPAPPGMNRFDLHPFFARDGKIEDYRSDRKGPFKQPRPAGSRMGPQNMVVCGWALQALQVYGDIWEERHVPGSENDQAVFIDQFPPAQAAYPRESPFFEQRLGEVTFGLTSTRFALSVRGESGTSEVSMRIHSRPDAAGSFAAIHITDREITATNDQGQALRIERPKIEPANGRVRFSFTLPYTVVKDQQPWANGVYGGRYSVQIGKAVQNLYFTCEEEQVKRWLQYQLTGGLRTWQRIFQEKGYIPTALGAGPAWDKFSDTGGYAHLITAAAQWILYLEGKRDWDFGR